MAAFEATRDRVYLDKAESIASLIISRHDRNEGWRRPVTSVGSVTNC